MQRMIVAQEHFHVSNRLLTYLFTYVTPRRGG